MAAPRLLVIAGSARRASLNRRLAALAAAAAREAGAEVTELDLDSLALPVYHGDLEAAGMPEGARRFAALLAAHDGLLVASPEYNAFVPPLLVNSFDWASRVAAEGGAPSGLGGMANLTAGMLSASPGALGGQRSLLFLRHFLSTALAMLVVPPTASIGQAHQAFDDDGQLKDERQRAAVRRVVDAVIAHARRR